MLMYIVYTLVNNYYVYTVVLLIGAGFSNEATANSSRCWAGL